MRFLLPTRRQNLPFVQLAPTICLRSERRIVTFNRQEPVNLWFKRFYLLRTILIKKSNCDAVAQIINFKSYCYA